MNGELEPVLADVEEALRGGYQSWSPEPPVAFLGAASNSTATVSTFQSFAESFDSPVIRKSQ
jgi:hypothetical protein